MTTTDKAPVTEAGVDMPAQLVTGAAMVPPADTRRPASSWERNVDPVSAAGTGPRPLDHIAHNLPVQLTSFVGRDAEMAQVRELLAGSRMVTLTGAGGVGKTRLALQVAVSMLTEFPAGVWLVDLAPLTDPALVSVTVARALGLLDAPGSSTMATVTAFLRARRTLVLLDNCEHLLDACAQLAEELLRACPGLVILATSREPVGVAAGPWPGRLFP